MPIQSMMNSNWCNDLKKAPRYIEVEKSIKDKKYIDKEPVTIWATDGKIVTKSYYVLKEDRWNMFTKENPPIAWQEYLIPEFKGEEHDKRS